MQLLKVHRFLINSVWPTTLQLRKLYDLRLCCKTVARQVVKLIVEDASPDNHILMHRPGDLLLPEMFLDRKVPGLYLYENKKSRRDILKEFCDEQGSRAQIFPFHPFLGFFQGLTSPVWSILKEKVSNQDWSQESCLIVVATLHPGAINRELVPGLVHSLTSGSGLFSCGRVPHYVLVSGYDHVVMTDIDLVSEHARGNSCWKAFIFHTFFDVTTMCSFPADAFNTKISIVQKKFPCDKSNLYLMKFVPRSDLFSRFGSREEIADIIYTARNLMRHRDQRLIPLLELWFPGIGRDLILQGYTMTDRLRDLNFAHYPDLFKVLHSHPEYSQSPFKLILASPKPGRVDGDELAMAT